MVTSRCDYGVSLGAPIRLRRRRPVSTRCPDRESMHGTRNMVRCGRPSSMDVRIRRYARRVLNVASVAAWNFMSSPGFACDSRIAICTSGGNASIARRPSAIAHGSQNFIARFTVRYSYVPLCLWQRLHITEFLRNLLPRFPFVYLKESFHVGLLSSGVIEILRAFIAECTPTIGMTGARRAARPSGCARH